MQTDTPAARRAPEAGPAKEPCAPRRGRPRSEAAEQAIFAAVEQLMEDGVGLAELSIERVAAAAGVGKATIYRRWPNMEALLVDVVARLEAPPPQLTGGSVHDDLVGMVDYMRKRGLAKRSRWVLKSALGQMNDWPELRAIYQERVVKPRRELVRTIVRRGVDEGVLRADLDQELVCEVLIGPILLRTILWDDAPLDDPGLAHKMIDAVLNGVGAHPPRGESH
ncbi:TetR-like C-terminal domain-containing protein [Kitasatospora sp. NPDC048540]|uniref:TetR-like C-terminal domain-containing protein n=1 Tax=Kitasatospora sp. NPDC048540 TaxID=3155634 RepID=UPI0033C5093C